MMDVRPLFKKLTQVGFVVKDCRATAKRYWDEFGIGPWEFYTLDPSNTPDMTLRGRAVEHAFRAALAKVGDVGFELIEPLSGASLYAEHLSVHGEGLHHLAFEVENLGQMKILLGQRGYGEIQAGRPFGATTYSYFDTGRTLAFIAELGEDIEGGKPFPAPELTYP
jgi:methylmalonyl-CoA/ethylmalonyl-CoA epimerase